MNLFRCLSRKTSMWWWLL